MASLTESVEKIWNVGIQVDPTLVTGEAQELVIQIGDYGTIEQEVVLEQRVIDTTAPTITNWEINPETNTLSIKFSEAMADLKNPEHYLITDPNGNPAPVTVVEYTEDSVLLMIEGFDNAPGWRAEFARLMDASPNRNLLESEPILITPEIVEVPEQPVPEEPTSSEFNFAEFILDYWQIILAAGILLLVLIFYIVFKPSGKKDEVEAEEDSADEDSDKSSSKKLSKHDKIIARSKKRARSRAHILSRKREQKEREALAEFSEDGIAVSEANGPVPERKGNAPAPEEESGSSAPRAKRVRVHWFQKVTPDLEDETKEENAEETVAVNDFDPKQKGKAPKRKRVWFRWFRKVAPELEEEVTEENAEEVQGQAAVNENYGGGVMMSKGSSPLGAAPTRDTSSAANSSADSDASGDVHVSEHKRERRGLFGFFRSRKSGSEEMMGDDDLGVAVNEPLRGVTAPTRKDNTLPEDSDEYEVDKVSQHRKAPKVKRARRGWFTWRKKDIPEVPETEEKTEETVEENAEKTEEAAALAAAETGEEVSEKTARKYIKTKKKWWQRKKKAEVAETEASEEAAKESTPEVATEPAADTSAEAATETSVAETGEEVSEKTARKYIKPRKNWFKKKMKPMIEQNIPERAAEETVAEAAAEVAASTSETVAKEPAEAPAIAAADTTDKPAEEAPVPKTSK